MNPAAPLRRIRSINGATTAPLSHAATRSPAVAPGNGSGALIPPGSGVAHTVAMPTSISAAISA